MKDGGKQFLDYAFAIYGCVVQGSLIPDPWYYNIAIHLSKLLLKPWKVEV